MIKIVNACPGTASLSELPGGNGVDWIQTSGRSLLETVRTYTGTQVEY